MKNLKYILFNSLTFNIVFCIAFAMGYIIAILKNEQLQTTTALKYMIPVIIVIILIAITNGYYALKLFKNKIIIRNYDPNSIVRKTFVMLGFLMIAINVALANFLMIVFGAIFINCLNNDFTITALIIAIMMMIPPFLVTGGQNLLMGKSILNKKSKYKQDYLISLKFSSNDTIDMFLVVSKYQVLIAFMGDIIIKLVNGIPFVFYKTQRFSIKTVSEYLKVKNTELVALTDDDFKIIEMMDI